MKKPFVTNWLKAIEYFMWAYLISQIIAIIARIVTGSDIGHFCAMMIMLPSFAFYYSGRYLATVPVAAKENRRLGLLWMGMAFLMDFLIYFLIARFPLVRIYLYGLPFLLITYILTFVVPFAYKRQKPTPSEVAQPNLDSKPQAK